MTILPLDKGGGCAPPSVRLAPDFWSSWAVLFLLIGAQRIGGCLVSAEGICGVLPSGFRGGQIQPIMTGADFLHTQGQIIGFYSGKDDESLA